MSEEKDYLTTFVTDKAQTITDCTAGYSYSVNNCLPIEFLCVSTKEYICNVIYNLDKNEWLRLKAIFSKKGIATDCLHTIPEYASYADMGEEIEEYEEKQLERNFREYAVSINVKNINLVMNHLNRREMLKVASKIAIDKPPHKKHFVIGKFDKSLRIIYVDAETASKYLYAPYKQYKKSFELLNKKYIYDLYEILDNFEIRVIKTILLLNDCNMCILSRVPIEIIYHILLIYVFTV